MTPRFISRMDMFPTPVWCFEFPNFKERKESLVKYLDRDEMYFMQAERNGLHVTEGNLNDKTIHPDLSDVTDFFQMMFEEVMRKCGYVPDIGMVSLWATRQKSRGFHHEHIHPNSMFASVLYVHDEDGEALGTTFKNALAGVQVIEPRLDFEREQFFKTEEQLPFIPGMGLVFPSWVLHSAPVCDSTKRIIMAGNAMPIGRTNSDHFHQYVYPKSVGFLPLSEDIKSGYIQNRK